MFAGYLVSMTGFLIICDLILREEVKIDEAETEVPGVNFDHHTFQSVSHTHSQCHKIFPTGDLNTSSNHSQTNVYIIVHRNCRCQVLT